MDAVTMKGTTVRRLKSYTSWVKYVVRQYGFYLLRGIRIDKGLSFVRKEHGVFININILLIYGLPVVYKFKAYFHLYIFGG